MSYTEDDIYINTSASRLVASICAKEGQPRCVYVAEPKGQAVTCRIKPPKIVVEDFEQGDGCHLAAIPFSLGEDAYRTVFPGQMTEEGFHQATLENEYLLDHQRWMHQRLNAQLNRGSPSEIGQASEAIENNCTGLNPCIYAGYPTIRDRASGTKYYPYFHCMAKPAELVVADFSQREACPVAAILNPEQNWLRKPRTVVPGRMKQNNVFEATGEPQTIQDHQKWVAENWWKTEIRL